MSQRNPDQKFMTGATVDDYVMGGPRSEKAKSPGIAANTMAIREIVYTRKASKAATAAAAAPSAAPVPARDAPGGRRRRAFPSVGFFAGGKAHVAGDENPHVDDFAELSLLEGHDETDSAEKQDYLKKPFGNVTPNVLAVLRLWEAYGEVFSAWRVEWEEDTMEYNAKRALAFLREGMKFSYYGAQQGIQLQTSILVRALLGLGDPAADLRIWRHLALLYVHSGVPRRSFKVPCPSRHQLAPTPVRWYGFYNYVDRKSGAAVRRTQKYNSSPMEQMLYRVCYQESSWHNTKSAFARSAQL